jgi:uncharacterized protein
MDTLMSTSHTTVRDQVARHPMLAFIALAYVFSSAWLLNYLIDLGAVNGFGVIGSASPALAAMIVSSLLRPEPSGIPVRKRWRLFGITGILALGVMAVLRLWAAEGLATIPGISPTATAYPSPVAFLMDVVAAGVTAFVLSGVCSSRQGVRDLLHSLDPRGQRVRWHWWAIAMGLYPAVIALSNAISAAVGLQQPAPKATGPWYCLVLSALIMLPYFLFGGGGLEEPGWRGFALPMLQKRYSPLRSSLILGVIWAFWHWPVLLLQVPTSGSLVVAFFLIQVIALAILFTVVFNWTGGSLPIVILLHASINLTEVLLPISTLATILWLLLLLGLAMWMWRSPWKLLVPGCVSRRGQ